MNKIIKFHNFKVNTETRELFFDGEKVKIQKKSFDLLLYLIEHKHQAVSKDQLLESLWDGRFVSESVLSHASTKLRTALNDNNGKGKIIRTVYGFGLQFVGEIDENVIDNEIEVEVNQKQIKTSQESTSPSKPKAYVFAVVTALLTITLYFFVSQTTIKNPPNSTDTTDQVTNTPKTKISFLAVKQDNLKPQWQLQGTTYYLNQILQLSGISMSIPTSAKAVNFYSIDRVIKTQQQDNNLILNYYNQDKQISDLTVSLDDLPLAIKKINQWVCSTILTKEKSCQSSLLPLAIDNAYLVETFMRGRASLIDGSMPKAISLFKVCLEQDAQFELARLALSEAYFGTSEYKKAISQAQVIIQTSQIKTLKLHAYKVIGKAYFRLAEFELAAQAFNTIIQAPSASKNIKAIAMYELAKIKNENGNADEAFELAKQSQEYAAELDLPITLARAFSIMGDLKLTQGELVDAQKYLLQAYKIFEQLNYDLGIEYILSPLGAVMEAQGKLQASLAYAKQRQAIAEKIGDPLSLAGTYLHMANLLIKMGKLDEAQLHASKMWDIVVDLDEPQALIAAYYIAGEIAHAQNKHHQALEKYSQALIISQDLGIKSSEVELLCSMATIATDAKLFDKAQQFIDQCHTQAKSTNNRLFQAVSYLYLAQLQLGQNKQHDVLSSLKNAIDEIKDLDNDEMLFEITLTYFDYYIDSDLKKATQYLNKTPQGFQADYHFILANARVQYQHKKYTQALQLALEAKQIAQSNWKGDDEKIVQKIQSHLSLNKQ